MQRPDTHLNEEDKWLLKAIAQNDKRLFETFYKTYYHQLYAIAYRYVGDAPVAEEIVHDVFIKIWNKADQLNIQHSMKSYLFKSTVNAALNFLKKEKLETEKRLGYLSLQKDYSSEEEEAAGGEAFLLDLENALEALPEKCRQVMYLSRFGKLKQQEIALQMDISVKTVKNHLTYGFQRLRAHLEKHRQMIITLMLCINIWGQ